MHDCSIVKYQSLEEPEQSSAQSIIEFLLDGWRQSVNHSQVPAHTWLSFQCKNKLFQSISQESTLVIVLLEFPSQTV